MSKPVYKKPAAPRAAAPVAAPEKNSLKAKIFIRGPGVDFEPPVRSGFRYVVVSVTTDISEPCSSLTIHQPFGLKGVLELCNNPACRKDQAVCTGLQLTSLALADRKLVAAAVIEALREKTIQNWEIYLPRWEARLAQIDVGDCPPVAAPESAALTEVKEKLERMEMALADAQAQIAGINAAAEAPMAPVGMFAQYGGGWESLGPYPSMASDPIPTVYVNPRYMQSFTTGSMTASGPMFDPMSASGPMFDPMAASGPMFDPMAASAPMTASGPMNVCAFHNTVGGCRNGAACPYFHVPP